MKISKREKSFAQKKVKSDLKIISKILKSSPGFAADKKLRQLLVEFNHRLMSAGIHSLPSIYNAVQSFYILPNLDKHIFRIKNEKDHLFYLNDFFEYITSEDSGEATENGIRSIEDNIIYSFNTLDPKGDISISSDAGTDFFVYSLSFIKENGLLSVLAVIGKLVEEFEVKNPVSIERIVKESALVDQDQITKAKQRLLDNITNENIKMKIVPITPVSPKEPEVQACLAAIKIDLKYLKVVNRYFYEETEASYSGFTDDEGIGISKDEIDEVMLEQLDKYRGVFELCSMTPSLISYFQFKYKLVKNEKFLTALGKKNKSLLLPVRNKKKKKKSKPAINQKYLLKRVPALRIISESKSIRNFSPPKFLVEVSGYYRRLNNPESFGKDQQGRPIKGLTWIKSHERWKDRPKRRKEVLIKSRLSIAKQIVRSQELANEILASKPVIPNVPAVGEKSDPKQTSREEQYIERRKVTAPVRYAVFNRDDFRCVLCGADAATEKEIRLHVDHIFPVSKGGKTTMDNLRTLCSRCNIGKSDTE